MLRAQLQFKAQKNFPTLSNQVSGVNLRVTPSKYQREVCFTVVTNSASNLNFEYLIVTYVAMKVKTVKCGWLFEF